jgi:hypothetical protein
MKYLYVYPFFSVADVGKGSGNLPFASRDIRLLEDPHMFDKPKDGEKKKREGRGTEKSDGKKLGWKERRVVNIC